MSLSLIIASCGTESTEGTITSTDDPQYGGTLTVALGGDVSDFLPWSIFTAAPVAVCNEWLWNGDWTKGIAGGYGTNDVSWGASTNLKPYKAYFLADNIHWEIDEGGKTGTIYFSVKEGVHFSLDPDNPISVMVGGREVTIDDVIWNYDMRMNDPRNHPGLFLHTSFPWTEGIFCKKIGPREASFTCPIAELLNGVMLLCDGAQIMPPEVDEQYGEESTTNFQVCVGAGAFMMTDHVADNKVEVKRNPNYWGKNPIGPGKGDQLPYLDGIKYLIMADVSTQQAGFRTAQLDQISSISIEDKATFLQQKPELKHAEGFIGAANLLGMRTDKEGTPFADVNVRRAMMMATDFNEINEGLYQGLGHILTWPYWKQKGYEGLYLDLDDPDMPATVKELYVYNPDKARQLIVDAGYPDGFKAEVMMTQGDVDYYSIVKEMWEKVGIKLEFSIVEFPNYYNMLLSRNYNEMITGFIPPPSSWPEVAGYTGVTMSNFSLINDAHVNQATAHMLTTAITDLDAAMAETRELMKYLLEGAWVIPTPRYPTYTLWWPWLKNYSGENSVGWLASNWPWWVYIDQGLKTQMGY
jgi:peptide/nickel transport system substrate-binding protein